MTRDFCHDDEILLSKGSQDPQATLRDCHDTLFGHSPIKTQDISIIESNW
jgi:hypothetical protein